MNSGNGALLFCQMQIHTVDLFSLFLEQGSLENYGIKSVCSRLSHPVRVTVVITLLTDLPLDIRNMDFLGRAVCSV